MKLHLRRALRWWSGRNGPGVPVAVFVGLFGATTYALTPGVPGRDAIVGGLEKRLTDQNYSGCSEARRNSHENIGFWEPSYRPEMMATTTASPASPIAETAPGGGGWLGN